LGKTFYSKCGPRLDEAAGKKLIKLYVDIRNGHTEQDRPSGRRSSIPITVRQLEAIIRISESLAKMSLLPFANEGHVEEAFRLFSVSTLKAAMSGDLAGAEGFTSEEEHQQLIKMEKQIKKRFPVGSQVAERSILTDLMQQNYDEKTIFKVIQCMIRKGELQYRMQRKMLFRLK